MTKENLSAVHVGLLGLGTVGCGTANVLARNEHDIARRAGRSIRVKKALIKNPTKKRSVALTAQQIVTDAQAILSDDDIQVVVELIGGVEEARRWVLAAIEKGKHVVTANKALIAQYGNEIFMAAQRQGVMVAFEAAVAGGIPIIKSLREGLAANQIQWLAGIINGTSNYILTAMEQQHRPFAEALAQAQQLGYAEADPSFDIDGTDVAHKLTILSAIAFGIPLQLNHVYRQGITDITPLDVQFAHDLGYHIKHLGIARRTDKGVELRVHPTLIAQDCLLSHVNDAMNALWVQGDAVGPTLFYGQGAGAEPTASAVVADLVDVVRALTSDPENRVPHLAFQVVEDIPVVAMSDVISSYYLRLMAQDKVGVLADVTRILSEQGISVESIVQKESLAQNGHVPIVIMTHQVSEGQINGALQKINALPDIAEEVMMIRQQEFSS